MIPVLATVRIETGRTRIGFWAPLLLLWLLLAPLAVVLSPLLIVMCLAMRLNPARAAGALAGVLCALPGVRVEVESPGATVLVRIV
jgi:hypothetical protein